MKKVLIVYGGWKGHRPLVTSEFFAQHLIQAGLQVELSDTLDILEQSERLKEFSLIIPNWTMGSLTEAQESSLANCIHGGVGLAGFHGGMGDAFRANPLYQFIVGGQFVAHPDDHKEYSVQILPGTDPITQGLSDFKVYSEQYYLHVDPSNEVLATTVFQPLSAPWVNGCRMPVAWKRHYGAGRIFYCALGHNTKVFEVPEALQLTLRGMRWAAGHLEVNSSESSMPK